MDRWIEGLGRGERLGGGLGGIFRGLVVTFVFFYVFYVFFIVICVLEFYLYYFYCYIIWEVEFRFVK